MWQSHQSASNPTSVSQLPSKPLSLTLWSFANALRVGTRIPSLSLIALLGLAGSFYIAQSANAQIVSQADITEINLSLNRQPGESYDTLVRRAETVAREAAQRSFTQNSSVAAVAVTVLGQNEGSIAPLLSLDVNRQNWSSNSNPQRWTTYFKNSRTLLRLDDSGTSTAAQPATQTPAGTSPVQVLPGGTVIVPGNVPVQVVPGGAVGTPSTVPGQQVAPNGAVGTPSTVPGQQVAPNGTVGTPSTVPGQQVAPNGTVGTPSTVPGQQVAPNGTAGTPGTVPGQQGTGNIIPGNTGFQGTNGFPGTTGSPGNFPNNGSTTTNPSAPGTRSDVFFSTPTNNSGTNTNPTNFNTTGPTGIQNQSGQDLGGNTLNNPSGTTGTQNRNGLGL